MKTRLFQKYILRQPFVLQLTGNNIIISYMRIIDDIKG